MVETIGICETHQLPLDRHGECELCRLNLVPSKAPPSSSPWWALIIPLLLLGAGVAWALSSFGTKPEVAPQRGVQGAQPRAAAAASVTPEASEPESSEPDPKPDIAPAAVGPSAPDQDLPMDDIPVPEPSRDR